MKKAHFNALGLVFQSEINQALKKGAWLPFQSAAKVFRELHDEGYLKQVVVSLGVVRVIGWELTELGRLSFCMQCHEPEAA